MRRIVVGVDRSAGSRAAVKLAARLAHDLAAGVEVVHATRSPREAGSTDDDVRGWCRPLVDAGVADIRTVIEDDDAVRLLYRVAEESDAYLIVVGPPEHSELGEFIWGSAAVELAHHGRRPLVIAPTEHSEINPF